MTQEIPVVAIVGRPNVGKSSLLNRLVERQVSIVDDRPGVTRDRIYAPCTWNGRDFLVVDTGGLSDEDPFWRNIATQVEQAIREADLILFVVDAREPLTHDDELIAERMRRIGKPVLLVANKAERRSLDTTDIFRLGIGEPQFVSAIHGHGTGDLLDAIVERLQAPSAQEAEPKAAEEDPLRVAIVGRPNAGKSTLVNQVLGQGRMLVSEVPGTTTDAVDVEVERAGRKYVLVDTAGLRRPARVREGERLEDLAGKHARRAVKRSDVAVLLLDADEGLTEQDKRIVKLCSEAEVGFVIGVNKWDQRRRGEKEAQELQLSLRNALPAADYAPIVFLSAKTGLHVDRLFQEISIVAAEQSIRIPTAQINREIDEALYQQPPPSVKGRQLKVLYATQVGRRPPHFILFVNDPDLCHFSYQRYIENRLRQAFALRWTPVRLTLRRREGRPR
ncbi:MAG: ribosome biogenesis GTPase Der [Thermaerobacter sp.]|nr:ribosome biogenesis GTPase Der [Thermaerobacter sp.]